jgi:hypothetical protein
MPELRSVAVVTDLHALEILRQIRGCLSTTCTRLGVPYDEGRTLIRDVLTDERHPQSRAEAGEEWKRL